MTIGPRTRRAIKMYREMHSLLRIIVKHTGLLRNLIALLTDDQPEFISYRGEQLNNRAQAHFLLENITDISSQTLATSFGTMEESRTLT